MTIKAAGWVERVEEVGGQIAVDVAVSNLAGETHHNVRAGAFAPDALPADVAAALATFIRGYAESDLGVTFDAGDDVRLWDAAGGE